MDSHVKGYPFFLFISVVCIYVLDSTQDCGIFLFYFYFSNCSKEIKQQQERNFARGCEKRTQHKNQNDNVAGHQTSDKVSSDAAPDVTLSECHTHVRSFLSLSSLTRVSVFFFSFTFVTNFEDVLFAFMLENTQAHESNGPFANKHAFGYERKFDMEVRHHVIHDHTMTTMTSHPPSPTAPDAHYVDSDTSHLLKPKFENGVGVPLLLLSGLNLKLQTLVEFVPFFI